MPRYLGTRHPYPTYPTQTRSFDNAMVIGPRFNPVPHRLVTAITSGHYVDLAALLASPSEKSSIPTLTLDGRLVITLPTRKSRQISDIVQWAQAFSIYMIVLVSSFPHMTRCFVAIEEAARGLTDWSHINAELYNVHTTYNRIPRSSFRRNPVVRVRCRPFLPLMELWALYSFWPPM